MTALIGKTARWAQLLYALMLLFVGFVGVWTARTEIQLIFRLQVESWPPDVAATFLNQYRFLKGLECGAGIFCVVFHSQIMEGGSHALTFVAIVLLGILGRTVAWIADGRPSALFLIFLALEIFVLGVFVLNARMKNVA